MSAFNLPSQLIFRGNGGSYPPYGAITSDNRGPVVVTFSWIFYSLSGLAALARLATRRSFGPDYWCLLTGWVGSFQTVYPHSKVRTNIDMFIAALDAGLRSDTPSSGEWHGRAHILASLQEI